MIDVGAVVWLRQQIERDRRQAGTVQHASRWRDLETTARCDAHLALLDLCARVIADEDSRKYGDDDGWTGLAVARLTVQHLAFEYRYRDGYALHWPSLTV